MRVRVGPEGPLEVIKGQEQKLEGMDSVLEGAASEGRLDLRTSRRGLP